MPAAVEQMTFEELVQTLAMFEQDREPSDVDRAIHRTAVERRLLGILSAGSRAAEQREAVRVPGDLGVKLYVGDEQVKATVRDLGEGGVGIRCLLAPPIGATLDIELIPKRYTALNHPPRAQAIVAWVRAVSDHGYDLGLSFIGHDDAHRRRMRRLVVELLRRLPAPIH
jgi:hypothetical protein